MSNLDLEESWGVVAGCVRHNLWGKRSLYTGRPQQHCHFIMNTFALLAFHRQDRINLCEFDLVILMKNLTLWRRFSFLTVLTTVKAPFCCHRRPPRQRNSWSTDWDVTRLRLVGVSFFLFFCKSSNMFSTRVSKRFEGAKVTFAQDGVVGYSEGATSVGECHL